MADNHSLDRIEDKVELYCQRIEAKLDAVVETNARQDIEIATIKAHLDKFEENIKRFYGPEGAWGSLVKRLDDHIQVDMSHHDDTEARLRKLEESVVRHTVYSALGAAVSAAAIAAAFEWLIT